MAGGDVQGRAKRRGGEARAEIAWEPRYHTIKSIRRQAGALGFGQDELAPAVNESVQKLAVSRASVNTSSRQAAGHNKGSR